MSISVNKKNIVRKSAHVKWMMGVKFRIRTGPAWALQPMPSHCERRNGTIIGWCVLRWLTDSKWVLAFDMSWQQSAILCVHFYAYRVSTVCLSTSIWADQPIMTTTISAGIISSCSSQGRLADLICPPGSWFFWILKLPSSLCVCPKCCGRFFFRQQELSPFSSLLSKSASKLHIHALNQSYDSFIDLSGELPHIVKLPECEIESP